MAVDGELLRPFRAGIDQTEAVHFSSLEVELGETGLGLAGLAQFDL